MKCQYALIDTTNLNLMLLINVFIIIIIHLTNMYLCVSFVDVFLFNYIQSQCVVSVGHWKSTVWDIRPSFGSFGFGCCLNCLNRRQTKYKKHFVLLLRTNHGGVDLKVYSVNLQIMLSTFARGMNK